MQIDMDSMQYIGLFLIILIFAIICIGTFEKVKDARDFNIGNGNVGLRSLTGGLVGTVCGGASTIGTAQMAFTNGFSAWWFTLGGAMGLLLLCYVFVCPIKKCECNTITSIIASKYGKQTALWAAILMSIGTFISIVSQMISGVTLLIQTINITSTKAVILIAFLMLIYVILGGMWGIGKGGFFKSLCLVFGVLMCGGIAAALLSKEKNVLTQLPWKMYFNLFSRGINTDLNAAFSVILGVISTQSYIQVMIAAKDIRTQRTGTVLAACITILVGLGCILVGFIVKINHPMLESVNVLPFFIMNYLPPLMSGILIGILLITIIGTGASLALGMSTTISQDIYKEYFDSKASEHKMLWISRLIILLIFFIAAVFALGGLDSVILNWSFMSMGLRGAVGFAPLCFALFSTKLINEKYVKFVIFAGPTVVLLLKILFPQSSSTLLTAVTVTFIGMMIGQKRTRIK